MQFLKNVNAINSHSFMDIRVIGQMKKCPLPPPKAKSIKTEGNMHSMAPIFAYFPSFTPVAVW